MHLRHLLRAIEVIADRDGKTAEEVLTEALRLYEAKVRAEYLASIKQAKITVLKIKG